MATEPVSHKFIDPKGWAALVAVLLVALGAAVLALIAQHSSNGAVECVNHVLGARSDLTVLSGRAQKTFADADKTYNAAMNQIVEASLADPNSAQSIVLRQRYEAASEKKAAASAAYSKAMQHIIDVAAANPLGHC